MTIAALGIAGFLISVYIWYKHLTTGAVLCIGSGCATVIRSRYGRLLGIPNGALGAAYFLAVALTPVLQMRAPAMVPLITAATGVALILYVYLAYLQVFVLRALCNWCLMSAALTGGILWALLKVP